MIQKYQFNQDNSVLFSHMYVFSTFNLNRRDFVIKILNLILGYRFRMKTDFYPMSNKF